MFFYFYYIYISNINYINYMEKKKIPPFEVDYETYKKLQKIIAKMMDETDKFVSVREVMVTLIDEKYNEISGSIQW